VTAPAAHRTGPADPHGQAARAAVAAASAALSVLTVLRYTADNLHADGVKPAIGHVPGPGRRRRDARGELQGQLHRELDRLDPTRWVEVTGSFAP
jgi:hypothetical protein